ncbi:hypothetical protein C0J52_09098, partial [Blattella germanica]
TFSSSCLKIDFVASLVADGSIPTSLGSRQRSCSWREGLMAVSLHDPVGVILGTSRYLSDVMGRSPTLRFRTRGISTTCTGVRNLPRCLNWCSTTWRIRDS